MAKHQIIYTSCMRGIDGVNDGQQIFSYDESFKDHRSDDVKGLFTYQVPSLPTGTVMTDEIAKTMPMAFMYRMMKNGQVSITQNTYLGRDYMGSTGRFGNQLGHSLITDFSDLDLYPSELNGSQELRSQMDYEEVNNPNPPLYLPIPNLLPGYKIDINSIIEFLEVDENLGYYKQMVTALLRFTTEKKRVIICDEPENRAKWIAALHYALPLDIAKRVNFTTYEFDPELSPAQICGVIQEGTRYNVESYMSSNKHYVFDFLNNQFTPVEVTESLMAFLDTAFTFSYDSLKAFHDFVMTKTIYRECSEEYFAAYYLYELFTDGIEDLSKKSFMEIMSFSENYLTEEVKKELIYGLLNEYEAIDKMDNDYAILVIEQMLKSLHILNARQQSIIKQMIVDRLIRMLSSSRINEGEFMHMYDNIQVLADRISLSIPEELMIQKNRESLLGVMAPQGDLWIIFFVIHVISAYVKEKKMSVGELDPERSIGAIFSGIVKMVYDATHPNRVDVIKRMLKEFEDEPEYYANVAIATEKIFDEHGIDHIDRGRIWSYFSDEVTKMEEAKVKSIHNILELQGCYDKLYSLFEKKLKTIDSHEELSEFFMIYRSTQLLKNKEYHRRYSAQSLKTYLDVLTEKSSMISKKDQLANIEEILLIAMEEEIKEDFVHQLSEMICAEIPFKKLKHQHIKLINTMYEYQREVQKEPIKGRLLLLIIALKLEKIRERNDFATVVQEIKSISIETGAKFTADNDAEVMCYYEWAFDALSKESLTVDELSTLYQLFHFTKNTQNIFMEYWCNSIYKKSKSKKDYSDFAEYLMLVFDYGNADDREMTGKYLCKFNKQKLEELDEEMNVYFKRDRKYRDAWKQTMDTALNTNRLFNNISSLFKKK